jgi:hypothetical protein
VYHWVKSTFIEVIASTSFFSCAMFFSPFIEFPCYRLHNLQLLLFQGSPTLVFPVFPAVYCRGGPACPPAAAFVYSQICKPSLKPGGHIGPPLHLVFYI